MPFDYKVQERESLHFSDREIQLLLDLSNSMFIIIPGYCTCNYLPDNGLYVQECDPWEVLALDSKRIKGERIIDIAPEQHLDDYVRPALILPTEHTYTILKELQEQGILQDLAARDIINLNPPAASQFRIDAYIEKRAVQERLSRQLQQDLDAITSLYSEP